MTTPIGKITRKKADGWKKDNPCQKLKHTNKSSHKAMLKRRSANRIAFLSRRKNRMKK